MFKSNRVLRDVNLVEILKQRNLIQQSTKQVITEKSKLTLYTGADPSAKSLHLGNLVPLLLSFHLNLNNNNIILLSGGATGVLGDPTFKTNEREKKDLIQLEENGEAIAKQQENFFKNATNYYKELDTKDAIYGEKQNDDIGTRKYVNNLNWFGDIKLLDFLHEYGSNFKIKELLSKESVKQRLNHVSSNGGTDGSLSIKEFFYQILQGYDFYHLCKHENCLGQIGGNDQWGNMTSGLEFMRRQSDISNDEQRFILSTPLIVDNAGRKFGKSEGNALFLNPKMTSIFEVYQYFINAMDEDVERYLKIFTLLSDEKIKEVVHTTKLNKSNRHAHKVLASNVVHLVHGKQFVPLCEDFSQLLFNNKKLLEYLSTHKEKKTLFEHFRQIYDFKQFSKEDDSDLFDIMKILEPGIEERNINSCLQNSFKFLNQDNKFEKLNYVEGKTTFKDLVQNCKRIDDRFVIFRIRKNSMSILEII
ncbi:hypothetical protein ACO0R3_002987 [Hanseniaspora guilliermondii]